MVRDELGKLSNEELQSLIDTMEEWFREDHEIEEERYSDETYEQPEQFLEDINQHGMEREAMRKLLGILEGERDRRNSTAGG